MYRHGPAFPVNTCLEQGFVFASLVTLSLMQYLLAIPNPLEACPNKAAADAITEILIEASRMNSASKNSMIPKGNNHETGEFGYFANRIYKFRTE